MPLTYHDVEPRHSHTLDEPSELLHFILNDVAHLFILLVEHRDDENENGRDASFAHSEEETQGKECLEGCCSGVAHEDDTPYYDVGTL